MDRPPGRDDSLLEQIVFASDERLSRRALFFSTGFRQASELPAKFGRHLMENGVVQTGSYGTTDVSGLFVAGDASRQVQFASVAAAEGAKAAFAINTALSKRELG